MGRELDCTECRRLLDAWLDGELAVADGAAVAAHLAACAACREERQARAAADGALRSLGRAAVGEPGGRDWGAVARAAWERARTEDVARPGALAGTCGERPVAGRRLGWGWLRAALAGEPRWLRALAPLMGILLVAAVGVNLWTRHPAGVAPAPAGRELELRGASPEEGTAVSPAAEVPAAAPPPVKATGVVPAPPAVPAASQRPAEQPVAQLELQRAQAADQATDQATGTENVAGGRRRPTGPPAPAALALSGRNGSELQAKTSRRGLAMAARSGKGAAAGIVARDRAAVHPGAEQHAGPVDFDAAGDIDALEDIPVVATTPRLRFAGAPRAQLVALWRAAASAAGSAADPRLAAAAELLVRGDDRQAAAALAELTAAREPEVAAGAGFLELVRSATTAGPAAPAVALAEERRRLGVLDALAAGAASWQRPLAATWGAELAYRIWTQTGAPADCAAAAARLRGLAAGSGLEPAERARLVRLLDAAGC